MSRKQTPSEYLKQIIGRPVVVKLNSGVDYRGFQTNFNCPILFKTKKRRSSLSGWVHEHSFGTDRRVCKWSIEKQIRRRIYSWK